MIRRQTDSVCFRIVVAEIVGCKIIFRFNFSFNFYFYFLSCFVHAVILLIFCNLAGANFVSSYSHCNLWTTTSPTASS